MPLRNPKVTVMMPAYNTAKHIQASIESVLRQDYPSFELIIYDDGSQDETYSLAKKYAHDKRVRLIRSVKSRGASYARNQIIRHARGEYLAPHDSDDLMLGGKLKVQSWVLDQFKSVGLVFGNAIVINESRQKIIDISRPYYALSNGKQHRLEEGICSGTIPLGISHCSIMFRKFLAEQEGGYDVTINIAHDFDLLLRLWKRTTFYYVNRFSYIYKKRAGSLVMNSGACSNFHKKYVRKKLLCVSKMSREVLVLIHQQSVRLISDNVDYFNLLKKNLIRIFPILKKVGGNFKTEIVLNVLFTAQLDNISLLGADGAAIYQWHSQGIGYTFNFHRACVSIFINSRMKFKESHLYHAAFLYPLSQLFLKFYTTIVHASLVSTDKTGGTLIMGRDGAGKSTLTVPFVANGFRYYSDEHPILELRQDHVIGLGLANVIGVPPFSMKNNFMKMERLFNYDLATQKYRVDPRRLNKDALGKTCRVQRILFPVFQKDKKLTLNRLSTQQTWERLLKDDYSLACRQPKKPWTNHMKIMKTLSQTCQGIEVLYSPKDIWRLPDVIRSM